MESKDIIRLQRDLTTNALNLMGEGDKKRYDGLSDGYRRWEKAIVNTFNSIGLNHLERFFKHKNVKQIGKTNRALWRNAFCLSDRRLIHNVVLGTITAEAALAADDDSQNGILLIAYFYEQWGSPSLPNTKERTQMRQRPCRPRTTSCALTIPGFTEFFQAQLKNGNRDACVPRFGTKVFLCNIRFRNACPADAHERRALPVLFATVGSRIARG